MYRVAAAYNLLSVHKIQRIMFHKKYIGYNYESRGGEPGGAEGAIAPPLCKVEGQSPSTLQGGGAEPLHFLLCLIGYY